MQDRILIVDDDPVVRVPIRHYLEAQGFQVEEAGSCAAAFEKTRAKPPSAVVLDFYLPDGDALGLLGRLKELQPELPVLILTGYGSIEMAVRAIKEGAENFLTKPVEPEVLGVLLHRVVENQRHRRLHAASRAEGRRQPIDLFRGTSAAIRELERQARSLLRSDSTILIRGETGTGKGVLAHWLHANGHRAAEAFVDLNCAGLRGEFFESELFGHEKGAFTGAGSAKQGLLEVADRGTVFLDEIGDVDPTVQPKLLKVLEEKTFRRLGDVRDRRVDIQLIAATHQDLLRLVREKLFREDLYYRIGVLPLFVPPLRERVEDIPVLARDLHQALCFELGRHDLVLSDEAITELAACPWPGNFRELRNTLERAILLSDGKVVRRRDVRRAQGDLEDPVAAPEPGLTLAEMERRLVEQTLRSCRGKVVQAAQQLGVPRSTLYEKIRRYGIDLSAI